MSTGTTGISLYQFQVVTLLKHRHSTMPPIMLEPRARTAGTHRLYEGAIKIKLFDVSYKWGALKRACSGGRRYHASTLLSFPLTTALKPQERAPCGRRRVDGGYDAQVAVDATRPHVPTAIWRLR